MKKAGLIISTKRAHFRISDNGLELLEENPTEITSKFLKRYDDFVKFQSVKNDKQTCSSTQLELTDDNTDQTPEESLEVTIQVPLFFGIILILLD